MKLSKNFYSATPYPHIIIDNFLSKKELIKLKTAIKNFRSDDISMVNINNSTTKKNNTQAY